MPLEFALRPRINMERPAPRRRLGWLRLPPLALPIAAYWLGIAGVTHTLIRLATVEASASEQVTVTSQSSEVTDGPSSDPQPLPSTSSSIAAERAATIPAPEPESEPESEPEPEPIAAVPEEEPPLEQALEAPPPREPAPAAQRALVSPPEPPPVIHLEPRAPERPAPSKPVEEPTPPRSALQDVPVARAASRRGAETASLPSCESAAASANETIDLGRSARGAPDLTRDAFASVLENGAYLAQCAIPARTALEICAAVQDGKVVGVSATTEPRDPALNACVRRAVAALRFPQSSRLDVTRTRFQATP